MNTISNVLITGGTGFVGSWMERMKPDRLNTPMLVVDSISYQKQWEEIETDYIVHLAPVSPTRAIKCARRNNARLLYASSGAVYHPENNTEYRRNKIKWEQECLDSGVDVVIARLFTFMESSRAWKALFSAAREGRPLEVHEAFTYEKPAVVRSFMHGAEMARWMWAILSRGGSGQAYDVGSDRPVSIMRLAQRIQAFTGCEIELVKTDIPVPIYLPPNAAKTKALL